ncbi:hypothetical protein TVAG_204130 [Trichomonas vaginalis G3]|uniref:Uncharacterized protein n=1 Tax=Trichomonas vaginalis (strain ATCC PRA-98 / G3) TaxID=412133 RepID=A2FXU3_TRIV3|nr:hypothetical protein TVAGG3_0692000 [Trichomonas vaginalis G3]EAX90278.1 hypothetical protein TVAG_204130 [Trichomonas vaginalis G3]KAI5508641.1 hypothetical protein TVAGG3_0692000 [Trichomonas vaginalis G3]|eukprot:XP_001303208.1 hypothetical protein [Trichomonas vaginalis G3]
MKLHSPEEIRAGKNQIHNLKKLISCQPEHSAIKHPSSQISPMKKMPQKTTKPRSHSVSLKIFIPQNTSQQSALPALTPSPNQRKMIFL